MGVLYRDRVLASLVNSGMRHRCAQAVTPRMRDLPCSPLTLNASRICSLIRYPLYSGLLIAAIWARVPRWPGAQLRGVLAQRPHTRAEGGGLVAAPGGAQLAGHAAAQLVQLLPGPLDDVERVQADLRLRRLLADHRVDPVRPVGGHVRQQPGPLLAEGIEERRHGGLAASLADPRDPPGVVVGDDDQVLAAALAPGLLVDPDPAQPVQPVQPGRGVRGAPGR